MKLNIKINFNILVGSLVIINIIAITFFANYQGKFLGNNDLFLITLLFAVAGIPIVLCILGIYGFIKKENKFSSILAIISGFIVLIIIFSKIMDGLKNFS